MSTPFDPDAFIALKRSFRELRQTEDARPACGRARASHSDVGLSGF